MVILFLLFPHIHNTYNLSDYVRTSYIKLTSQVYNVQK